jgi:hypothetical protein
VCLERYTRVLMEASLAFPIHFLKIYSISARKPVRDFVSVGNRHSVASWP